MPSSSTHPPVEHYVTLFDNNFLLMGVGLHQSLMQHGGQFHLWILCMDEEVERNLGRLALPHASLIPLREVEDERLLAVKPGRSRGEYCWTLTPFTAQFVFERDPQVDRVTYLDADLYFFGSPRPFFAEFEAAGKHVLITEHAYDPRYDKSRRSGRFCVQFLTFRRTPEAGAVMRWWQERCLEWCYARVEGGKFGDQKYLDVWPELFGDAVHILRQTSRTLAPWNVRYFERQGAGRIAPVFYHFHGLRLIAPGKLMLYSGYDVGQAARELYAAYGAGLQQVVDALGHLGIAVPHTPLRRDLVGRVLRWKRRAFGGEGYATMPRARGIA
jgi:hypothetical protein